MFKKILVPTDGSHRSEKAAQTAIDLARQLNGTLVALSVVEPYPFPPISESPYTGGSEAYEHRALELAEEHVKKIATAAAVAQVPCETAVAYALNPYEEIIAAVEKYGCDAIVMATHGRKGLNRLFAGSETQKVIAHTKVPVVVIQ